MSIVILQDEIVHYEVLGRGRPLIFLHGWVGSWRYWIPAMQAVSISYRTYALDMWGFGDSAKVPEYYHLDQQVNLIHLFMQEMGIGKIALIGHGLGAVVSLLYAQKYRGFVDRVMAINLPNGLHKVNQRLQTASPTELVDWLIGRTIEGDAARAEAQKVDPRAILQSLNNLNELDLTTLSRDMTTPFLLVYGQDDPAMEEEISSYTQDTIPMHLHQISFDNSGHFPMLDEPSKFNRLLADFLALSSGTSPQQLQIKEEWKRRVR